MGLEAHLVQVAKAWVAGKSDVAIESIADFLTYLSREKHWYLTDHPRIRSTSVAIIQSNGVIYIQPGVGWTGPQTASIQLIAELVTDPAV